MEMKGLCRKFGSLSAAIGYGLGCFAVAASGKGDEPVGWLQSLLFFFPGLSVGGIAGECLAVLLPYLAGLSVPGMALIYPLTGLNNALGGLCAASALVYGGKSGIPCLLAQLPIWVCNFRLTSRSSAEAMRASYFTWKRMGLFREPVSQYADEDTVFSVGSYFRSALTGLLLTCPLLLYGELVERLFPLI